MLAATRQDFVVRAERVHGNVYDYSRIQYTNNKAKIEIICKKHGFFWQTPYYHINRLGNCPKCHVSKGEAKIFSWLIQNNFTEFEDFSREYSFEDLLDKKHLRVDFYLQKKNLIIEYNGEQHYRWYKGYHVTYHDFLLQKHHDWLKRKYAKKV